MCDLQARCGGGGLELQAARVVHGGPREGRSPHGVPRVPGSGPRAPGSPGQPPTRRVTSPGQGQALDATRRPYHEKNGKGRRRAREGLRKSFLGLSRRQVCSRPSCMPRKGATQHRAGGANRDCEFKLIASTARVEDASRVHPTFSSPGPFHRISPRIYTTFLRVRLCLLLSPSLFVAPLFLTPP